MNISNTGARSDGLPPPGSERGGSSGTGNAFVQPNALNNPARNNKGDAVGNAICSVLNTMFEVLPGRLSGALTPVASEAQSQTLRLMASVHAQDAVDAQRPCWDSVLWVKAGDALMTAFDGLGSLATHLALHARLPQIGPTGAVASPTSSVQSLKVLEDSLSDVCTLEKSDELRRYQAEGGDDVDGLVIVLSPICVTPS